MTTETLENEETNLDGSTGSEPAAPASNESDNGSAPDLSALAAEMGVDEDTAKEWANGDEDFAKLIKGEVEDTNKGSEDNRAEDKNASENSAAGADDKDGDAKDADDKNSGGGSEPVEFGDDVIKGLKGSDFGKLSEEAQVAISNFYTEAQAKAKEVEAAKSQMEKLLSDPVIRSRAEAIEGGNANNFQIRGVTEAEKQGLVSGLQNEFGLDAEDSKAFMSKLEAGITEIAQNMAQDYANRAIVAQDNARIINETNKKGQEVLLSLSQFNKSWTVKETDISKFYRFENGRAVYNEAHPEIETFRNGLGKICDWAGEAGIDYGKVLQMGAKSFYAAAAAALDMPVVFNAGERDKKIAADVRKKALEPFLKTNKSGTLNTQSGAEGAKKREEAGKKVMSGYDAERLVSDSKYLQGLFEKYWDNPEEVKKIEAIVEEQRSLLTGNK